VPDRSVFAAAAIPNGAAGGRVDIGAIATGTIAPPIVVVEAHMLAQHMQNGASDQIKCQHPRL
jgi:hypothetical protein